MKSLPTTPIGCWQVPATDIAKWQARGVNLLVGIPGGQDAMAWAQAVVAAGIAVIVHATDIIAQPALYAILQPVLVAVAFPDEPDDNVVSGGVDNAAWLAGLQQSFIAQFGWIGDWFINVDGWQKTFGKVPYQSFLALCRFRACDEYPVNRDGNGSNIAEVGANLDWLQAFPSQSNGNANTICFHFIETSCQHLWETGPFPIAPAPTAAQFIAEIQQVALKPNRYPIYFPQVVGGDPKVNPAFVGFAFDGTPADVAAAMTGIPYVTTTTPLPLPSPPIPPPIVVTPSPPASQPAMSQTITITITAPAGATISVK